VRRIKRYGNRKFYDTTSKRYVTLSEIAGIVRAGDDVEVIDHSTGEDITKQVLMQILSRLDKNSPPLPIALLTALVRGGEGILLDTIGMSVEAVLGKLNVPNKEDIERLRDAIDELERKLKELEPQRS
jgi:polyhydroxyalkanoate synthesis repressor PhaR